MKSQQVLDKAAEKGTATLIQDIATSWNIDYATIFSCWGKAIWSDDFLVPLRELATLVDFEEGQGLLLQNSTSRYNSPKWLPSDASLAVGRVKAARPRSGGIRESQMPKDRGSSVCEAGARPNESADRHPHRQGDFHSSAGCTIARRQSCGGTTDAHQIPKPVVTPNVPSSLRENAAAGSTRSSHPHTLSCSQSPMHLDYVLSTTPARSPPTPPSSASRSTNLPAVSAAEPPIEEMASHSHPLKRTCNESEQHVTVVVQHVASSLSNTAAAGSPSSKNTKRMTSFRAAGSPPTPPLSVPGSGFPSSRGSNLLKRKRGEQDEQGDQGGRDEQEGQYDRDKQDEQHSWDEQDEQNDQGKQEEQGKHKGQHRRNEQDEQDEQEGLHSWDEQDKDEVQDKQDKQDGSIVVPHDGRTAEEIYFLDREAMRKVFDRLTESKWVDDNCINVVLEVFNSDPSLWYVASTHLVMNGAQADSAPSRFKDLASLPRKLMFPLHLSGMSHWTLAVFDRKHRHCLVYDPMHSEQCVKRAFQTVQDFLKRHGVWQGEVKTDLDPFPSTHQTDETNCGIFVIATALHLLQRKTIESVTPGLWRELLAGFFSTEGEPPREWIKRRLDGITMATELGPARNAAIERKMDILRAISVASLDIKPYVEETKLLVEMVDVQIGVLGEREKHRHELVKACAWFSDMPDSVRNFSLLGGLISPQKDITIKKLKALPKPLKGGVRQLQVLRQGCVTVIDECEQVMSTCEQRKNDLLEIVMDAHHDLGVKLAALRTVT